MPQKKIHRRDFLKRAGLALSGGALGSLSPFSASAENQKNKYVQIEYLVDGESQIRVPVTFNNPDN